MQPTQHDSPVTNQPVSGKKTYHKPVVEIYGSLAEISETRTHSPTHVTDGSGPGWTPLST